MKTCTLFRFDEEFIGPSATTSPKNLCLVAHQFRRHPFNGHIAKAFTLVELLVVISILGILISLVLVGVARALNASRATVCRGNLRSIGIAANTYSTSNKGVLPSPRTDTPAGWSTLKSDLNDPTSNVRDDAANTYIGWVRTENISNPSFDSIGGTAPDEYETPVALESGSLYPYIGNSNTYKSPEDASNRIRSYSLNAFVGVMYCNDENDADGLAKNHPFDTRTISRIQKPAETLLALPEADPTKGQRGWNINGFRGNPDVTMKNSDTGPVYANGKWIDAPALWNAGFINMAMVDGSVTAYQIQSPQMINGELQSQWKAGAYPDMPDTWIDLYNLKMMLLPGKIK